MTAIRSTLTGMDGKITNIRRDGNTTRVIDNAIQLLFKHGSISVQDHHLNYTAGRELFFKILRRLENEHPSVYKNLKTDLGIITLGEGITLETKKQSTDGIDLNRTEL